MATQTLRSIERPRSFVAITGPDAAAHLNRMVSNDVSALEPGQSCEALLLTAKARIVARMTVVRRAEDNFLLLSEPGAGETIVRALVRARFASRCEVELVERRSTLVLGALLPGAIPNADYGVVACEVIDGEVAAEPIDPEELERLRIRARTPMLGREIDDRVMPAEAGLEERAISFTKGCYPGQEPVARLHYRGHPNRGLRVLTVPGSPPEAEVELLLEGKAVGRITSAAAEDGGAVVLAYVRREVPDDAVLALPDGRSAHPA